MSATRKRLAVLYRELDQELADQARRASAPPSCRRGCHECCHLRAVIADMEAQALVQHVRERQGDEALERLRLACAEQLRRFGHLTDREWFARGVRCVFLGEDGGCTVYEMRPVACRAHLVASDPRLCSHTTPGAVTVQIVTTKATDRFAARLVKRGAKWRGPLPYALLIAMGQETT